MRAETMFNTVPPFSLPWPLRLLFVSLGLSAVYVLMAYINAPTATFVDGFHRCDSYWYERIADEGYPRSAPGADLGHATRDGVHQTPWGFFPLYPWLIKGTSFCLGIGTRWSMFLWAWLFTALIPLVAYACFRSLAPEPTAQWGVLALLCYPFGIYSHVHMTEGLNTVSLLLGWLSVRRGWKVVLAISTSALVLVRPNGAIMMLPILVELVAWNKDPLIVQLQRPFKMLRAVWPLIFPTVCFVAYSGYQWHMTGTPFAFMEAEKGWGRHLSWPFLSFFKGGDVATQFESWFTLILIAVLAFIHRVLPLSQRLFMWIAVIFPLCSGTVSDMMRYSSVMFPIFLLLGQHLQAHRHRAQIIIGMVGLQLIWFGLWLQQIGGWLAC